MAAILEFNAMRALQAPLFPAEARVVHSIPGRLRLIVLSLKGDLSRADAICTRLRERAAARCIQVNPLTGSLLIEHEPNEAIRTSVLQALEEIGCVLMTAPSTPQKEETTGFGGRLTERAAAAVLNRVVACGVRSMLAALA